MKTLEKTKPSNIDNDWEPDHLYCCNPDLALCGADISESDFLSERISPDRLCVVCDDLLYEVCPDCGR